MPHIIHHSYKDTKADGIDKALEEILGNGCAHSGILYTLPILVLSHRSCIQTAHHFFRTKLCLPSYYEMLQTFKHIHFSGTL